MRRLILIGLVVFTTASLRGQTPSPPREARAKELLPLVSDTTGVVIGANWPETVPFCVQRPESVSSGVGYWCMSVGNLRTQLGASGQQWLVPK